MKLFITGGTGFVGGHVADAFVREDWQVTSLARSDASAAKLRDRGITPVSGDLTSLDTIAREANEADAVVHAAFIQDFDKWDEVVRIDDKVGKAIIEALAGSNKPFLATSGAGVLGDTPGAVDESFPVPPGLPLSDRSRNEQNVVQGAKKGVRSAVMRLPLYVYDKDGSIFSQAQGDKAKEQGAARYIDDGSQEATAVHIDDAADAYVLAVKHAVAGSIYHLSSGQASAKQIAEAVAARHGLGTKSISRAEADTVFGKLLAVFFALTNLTDSSKAHRELHWQPKSDSPDFLTCVAGTS